MHISVYMNKHYEAMLRELVSLIGLDMNTIIRMGLECLYNMKVRSNPVLRYRQYINKYVRARHVAEVLEKLLERLEKGECVSSNEVREIVGETVYRIHILRMTHYGILQRIRYGRKTCYRLARQVIV